MNDAAATPAPATAIPSPPPSTPNAPRAPNGRATALLVAVLALLAIGALIAAALTHQRLAAVEQELVRRQQDSQGQAAEARVVARQAQDAARDAAAKVALLEARVAENALQRSQVEELMQSLSRSRDENVVADVESSLRVAQQQSAITGSAEPLVAALRQADERLARYNQPRLERVRRAVVRDLDRVRAAGVSDIATLAIRLDETVRVVDELPLLSAIERRAAAPGTPARASAASAAASAAAPAATAPERLLDRVSAWWRDAGSLVWQEAKGLVRVTRIEHPEAMLVAPEQAFFVRENLKLRLLNARLALLSRQFDTAQADLRDAQAALERYFDRSSRRVQAAADSVRQVTQQSRLVAVPRPDETLAALGAAAAGR